MRACCRCGEREAEPAPRRLCATCRVTCSGCGERPTTRVTNPTRKDAMYDGRCQRCRRRRHHTGDYRATLDGLYVRVAADRCHVCRLPLGDDRTDEHVPSLALVRDRGPFGPMIVTASHAACNRGLIER